MKKYSLVFICLILISCLSCTNQDNAGKVIEFHPGQDYSLVRSYLRLDIPEDIVIGSVDQIEKVGDRILLLQTSSEYCGLYVFDTDGNYVGKAGGRGHASGEYLQPASFTVSGDTSTVTIIDSRLCKAYHYGLDSLDYKGVSRLFNTSYFEWAGPDRAVFENMGDEPFHGTAFVMTDSDFERLNGYVDEVIDSGYGTGPARPMYKYRSKVRAYYQYRPYLYEFDAEGMSIAYEFRFWKYSVPPESFMQEISRRGREFFDDLSGSGYVSYYEIFETEAAVLSYFMVNHKRYLGIYDKEAGTSSLWEEQDFGKVIPQLPLYVVGTYGDFFVSPMFASELKEADGLPADLQTAVSRASENDIVLMLFK